MGGYPGLLNINSVNKELLLVNHKVSEDRKLELRLGPPGEFLIAYHNNTTTHGTKRAFQHTAQSTRLGDKDCSHNNSPNQCQNFSCIEKTAGDTLNSCTPSPWSSGSTPYSVFHTDTKSEPKASFFHNLTISNKLAGMADEDFPQPCSSGMAEVQFPDRRTCSSLTTAAAADATTNNTSNKRIAYSTVIGWPPIRSFRKNLASNSLSKPATESPNGKEDTGGGKPENSKTQLFVKINMEGIPIGRKVNLSAYNSYEELSFAIDELFSVLLAAQGDSSASQNENKIIEESAEADADSLTGTGEYTLVYEDDEGDRMLVGDVPWHMFVSTAKRLHVLKIKL